MTFRWPLKRAEDDPFWDAFINSPPNDPANLVSDMIRQSTEGALFPTKADIHTPEVTSSHIKGFAQWLGAALVGIAKLDPPRFEGAEAYPFAVICAVTAEHDPRESPGVGGQVPVQNGLFVTFVLSAYIRELGYRATRMLDADGEQLAAAARLGTLTDGRLVTPRHGRKVHVADVIFTDLPLAADG